MIYFITFVQTLIDVMIAGIRAYPDLWVTFVGSLFALMLCAGDALEHRGWRATGWACVSASFFALWLVMAPEAAAR